MHANFTRQLCPKYLAATESPNKAEEEWLCVLVFWSRTPGPLSRGRCSPFTNVSELDSYLPVVYIEVSEINTELQLLFACGLVSKMITR